MRYVGVITVDTLEHNEVIVERCIVERATPVEAVADARELLALGVEMPKDSITDLHVSYVAYES